MKTIFRFFSFGLLLAVFAAAGTFAQDPCGDEAAITDLDSKIRASWPKTANESPQATIELAKQFLEKYGSCPTTKDFSEYLKKSLPEMERTVVKLREAAAAAARAAETAKLYTRFDTAYKTKNLDEVYAAGKEVLAKEPDNVDLLLFLGTLGVDQQVKGVKKYNDDTMRFAAQAIQKLNEGKTAKTFGLFDIKYKNKEDALGWMNFNIGYLTYYGAGNKRDALQYFYRAAQANSDTKTNPVVYETVGRYYLEETSKLADQVKTLAANVKDTDPEDVKTQKTNEIKAKVALLNGNAERAIDAYARAYKVAKTDAATKAYRDGLYAKIQNLYTVRFQKTDGVDTYIAGVVAKPMPDPTSAVTPIADAEVKTGASTAVDTSAQPAAPVTAKPASTVAATKTTAVKKTAPAKTPVRKVVARKN